MSKNRIGIPKTTQETILKEYSHSCAICYAPNPQLHHIDENPSNNDPLNLIPLCPNHHLNGQHRPHNAIHPKRLLLFRIHKHPGILAARFTPLFNRILFLEDIPDDANGPELRDAAETLCELVTEYQMGDFYVKRLKQILPFLPSPDTFPYDERLQKQFEREAKEISKEYVAALRQVRAEIHRNIVEMLWYQPWAIGANE